jgi:hypothetical protein
MGTTFLYTGKRIDFETSGVTDGNTDDHIVIWGHKFYRGIPLEVTDPDVVEKLTWFGGHPYFKVVPTSPPDSAEAEEVNALMPKKAKKG